MKKIYLYAMALGLMFASCEDFLTEYLRGEKRNVSICG